MKSPEFTPEESERLAEIAEINPALYRRILGQVAVDNWQTDYESQEN